MKSFLVLVLFSFSVVLGICNNVDSIRISGYFFGENLIVINPMSNNEHIVKSVVVNNKPTNDEIKSSAFEIDFKDLGLKEGDKVDICITYVANGIKPEFFNPQILELENYFSFSMGDIDKKSNKIVWSVSGSPGEGPFEIEQYCWEKWVKIADVEVADSISLNYYEAPFFSHKGKNLFRIRVVDANGIIAYSEPIKYASRSEEVFLKNKKFVDQIIFTDKTFYQLYDEKGTLRITGTDIIVDIANVESGKYWINYDNKTEMIKIK